ncbi:MAG: DsrE family protein [Halothiobacillaceae bacterium]
MHRLLVVGSVALALCGVGFSPLACAAEGSQRPIMQIENKEGIKAVYDARKDEWQAGIGKSLYYVRGLIEAYKKQGVEPSKLDIHIVLHGPTAYWALKDEAFQTTQSDPFAVNTNAKIIHDLNALGVKVEVCNVTLRSYGWTHDMLLPEVKIVFDAYTRMIELQQEGYAYIIF